MLYIQKLDDSLEILPDQEVKHFAAINFSEYFKSIQEEKISARLLNHFISF